MSSTVTAGIDFSLDHKTRRAAAAAPACDTRWPAASTAATPSDRDTHRPGGARGAAPSRWASGVGTSTGAVTFNSLLQSHVTDRTRGRVFSLMDLLWQTGRLASLGVGGVLADTVGIRAVYYLGGVFLLLAAAVNPKAGGAHGHCVTPA